MRNSNLVRGIVVLAIVLTLTACNQDSAPRQANAVPGTATRVQFLLDWTIEPNYVGFILAQEKGFFAKRGIDVVLQEGTGGSIATQAVAVGTPYIIGSSSGGATAIGRSRGLHVRSLAVIFPNITTVIISRSDNPIRKPSDLIGRTIGLVSGSVTVDEYRALLRAAGIDRAKVKEVGVSVDPAPLLTGQVDALIDYGDQMPAALIAKGAPITIMKLSDFGVRQYGLNIIANDAALAGPTAATVRKVVEAIEEGYDFARAHPAEAVDVFMKRFPQRDQAYVERSIRMVVAELGTDKVGTQTREGWLHTIESLDQLGLLVNPIDVNDVAASDYLAR